MPLADAKAVPRDTEAAVPRKAANGTRRYSAASNPKAIP